MANAAFAIEVVESFDEVGPQDGEGEDVGEEWRGACEREKVVGEVGEEGVGDCEPEEAVVEVEEEHYSFSFFFFCCCFCFWWVGGVLERRVERERLLLQLQIIHSDQQYK